ncbi:MAG: cysteine--tRNA ligase [Syntrophomonadaceae bacterium]|nr:cysteine--tRNA ligase [Syntrophomonadaceae bacterium]
MSLKMYNTLTRRKEEFMSSKPGRVGMYVCGPTTYNFIHLGNARPLVVFDTIRRYLEYRGYQVDYIQNFTDIDDKIISRAREEGEEPNKLAQRYIEEYFRDADALNVQRAKVHPRVSEHLPEIIAMIEGLLEKGYAYQVAGDVYFSVDRFAEYGKLSGRSLEDLQAGARVEVDERKQNPMDFALWKAAKEGEPAWASPWGPGRPGWHIECSAMSLKYLGFGFDIHGGGSDLIFPHHENEIAQSEAFAGQSPFCRYWLHNGFITVNQEKMSKSLGNFFLVRDILEKFPPQVVRFYLLSTHYRSPLDFDDGKLEMSRRSLERLKTSLDLLDELLGTAGGETVQSPTGTGSDQSQGRRLIEQIERSRQEFIEAMDDDFNTARATASLFELSREINSLINEVVRSGRQPDENERKALTLGRQALTELLGVLGLDPGFLRQRREFSGVAGSERAQKLDALINLTINLRQEARQRKDWATADYIRDGLNQLGITLEDTPHGSRVRLGEAELAPDSLIEFLIELRQAAREQKKWSLADQIRGELAQCGITLEDSPRGTRWRE